MQLVSQFFVARQVAKRGCYTRNFFCNLSRNGVALQVARKIASILFHCFLRWIQISPAQYTESNKQTLRRWLDWVKLRTIPKVRRFRGRCIQQVLSYIECYWKYDKCYYYKLVLCISHIGALSLCFSVALHY